MRAQAARKTLLRPSLNHELSTMNGGAKRRKGGETVSTGTRLVEVACRGPITLVKPMGNTQLPTINWHWLPNE